jgi:hypothetical protein
MTQPASVGLKYGFLIVLYLFLVWVAFSAVRDLRRGRTSARAPEYEPSADATGMYDAVSGPLDATGFEPRLLVEHATGHESRSVAATSRSGSRTRLRPRRTPGSLAKVTSS